MRILSKIRTYLDNNPRLKPYLLMWLRKTTKTIDKWPKQKLIEGVMDCYERRMGYRFNIEDPHLFTEKLQWYKVFYHNKHFSEITDKYLFKKYVADRIGEGYTIPCYGAWTSADDLLKDWDTLPEEFVLKANLQSDGRNIKIIHKKSAVSLSDIKKLAKNWLKPWNTLKNSWDCHFYCGTPRILAEEYVSNFENMLFDYKFFCFNGTPHYMYVAENDFSNDRYPITFYNIEWTKIDVLYGEHSNKPAEKPIHYDEMIKIAKQLSKDLPFVRVDFFDTPEKLYVAELTFAPGGGCTPYNPVSFNEELGELFVLPNSK